MPSSQLYRNQLYLCEVSIMRPASGAVELKTSPSQYDIVPDTEDVYHLRHRGRSFRIFIKKNFTFGPETRLEIEVGEQEL